MGGNRKLYQTPGFALVMPQDSRWNGWLDSKDDAAAQTGKHGNIATRASRTLSFPAEHSAASFARPLS